MGRGGYLGGGTIVSPWSLARDQARRRFEETTDDPSGRQPRRKDKTTASISSSKPVPPDVAAMRAAVRAKPGIPMTSALRERAETLKAQVAAGALLPTGKPNPAHPDNKKATIDD